MGIFNTINQVVSAALGRLGRTPEECAKLVELASKPKQVEKKEELTWADKLWANPQDHLPGLKVVTVLGTLDNMAPVQMVTNFGPYSIKHWVVNGTRALQFKVLPGSESASIQNIDPLDGEALSEAYYPVDGSVIHFTVFENNFEDSEDEIEKLWDWMDSRQNGTVTITKGSDEFEAKKYMATRYIAFIQARESRAPNGKENNEYNSITATVVYAFPGRGAEDTLDGMQKRGKVSTAVSKRSNTDKLRPTDMAVDGDNELMQLMQDAAPIKFTEGGDKPEKAF